MKKIVLFVSINFVFLFLNISVAQAACTVTNVNYATCLLGYGYCSPKFVQGWANATEDNAGDCRSTCRTWGTSGTYPANTSYRFRYYEYRRYSNLNVLCSVSTTNNMGPCTNAPPGGASECNY